MSAITEKESVTPMEESVIPIEESLTSGKDFVLDDFEVEAVDVEAVLSENETTNVDAAVTEIILEMTTTE